MISSVWKTGVGDNAQLYATSATIRPDPNPGKSGTSRPSSVRLRSKRVESDGDESEEAYRAAQSAHVISAPPKTKSGRDSNPTPVPSGPSSSSPPPANGE